MYDMYYQLIGNQTWLAGKYTIQFGDVPIQTFVIDGGFSIAMFDYQTVLDGLLMGFPALQQTDEISINDML